MRDSGVKQRQNYFEFTGAILRDGSWFVSLCLDVDVASQGRSVREAKAMLAEAVALYLETCFESNAPYLRPFPREDDSRIQPPENLVEVFPLKIDFKVRAVA